MPNQSPKLDVWNIIQTALMAVCVSLSQVVVWEVMQSSIPSGTFLKATLFAALALLSLSVSLGFLKRSPKPALFGIAVAVWTLFIWACPTLL